MGRTRVDIEREIKEVETDLEVAQVQVAGIGGGPSEYNPALARRIGYGFIALGVFLAVSMIRDGTTGGTLIVFGLAMGVATSGAGVALLLWIRSKERTLGRAQAKARARIAQLQAELRALES